MIDLHVHLLPGVDDGPATMGDAVAMARVAVADGVRTATVTPHVSPTYPTVARRVPAMAADLQAVLDAEGVALRVLPGAEVDPRSLYGLDTAALDAVALGGGPWVLLECPFAANVDFKDHVADLQRSGRGVLLAHPERSGVLRADPTRIADLVRDGACVVVSAGSLHGQFGETVRSFTATLLSAGLVHVIASDGHDPRRRPPTLAAQIDAARRSIPGLSLHRAYFTEYAPAAILAGEHPGTPPRVERPSGLRRLLRRG